MILYFFAVLFSVNIFAQSTSDLLLDNIIYNKTDKALELIYDYNNDINLLKPYNGTNILCYTILKHNYKLSEALIKRAKNTNIDVKKFVNAPDTNSSRFFIKVKPLELAVDIYIGTLNCCKACIDCQTTHESEYTIINLLISNGGELTEHIINKVTYKTDPDDKLRTLLK